jgi:hypothetical protein
MNSRVLADRHTGLNFIESGHIGVIIIFYSVFWNTGPLRERLLQYEPSGVDMSSPSPLNCPIFIFLWSQLSSI